MIFKSFLFTIHFYFNNFIFGLVPGVLSDSEVIDEKLQCAQLYCADLIKSYHGMDGGCDEDLPAALNVCKCVDKEDWVDQMQLLYLAGSLDDRAIPKCHFTSWYRLEALSSKILLLPSLFAPEVFILLRVSGILFFILTVGCYLVAVAFCCYRSVKNFR